MAARGYFQGIWVRAGWGVDDHAARCDRTPGDYSGLRSIGAADPGSSCEGIVFKFGATAGLQFSVLPLSEREVERRLALAPSAVGDPHLVGQ